MLFFVVSYVTDMNYRNIILHTIFIVALFSAIYGISQFMGIDYGPFKDYFGTRLELGTRIFTIFGNPNLQGGFGVFVIPLIAAFFMKHFKDSKKRLLSIYLGVTLLLSFIALLMSQTRGSWIAFVITMVLFAGIIIVQRKRSFVKKHSVLASIVVLIVIAAGFGGFQLLRSNEKLINPMTADIRLYYYTNTLDMVKDDLLFGKGVGTFNVHYPTYRDKRVAYQKGEFEMEYRVEHAHNEHLELLSDLGIVGYALFLWVIFEALYLLLKRKDIISIGMAAAILGLLIDGLMSQNLRFIVISSLLWLMIGLSTILPDQENIKKKYKFSLMKSVFSIILIVIVAFPITSAYRTMHSNYFINPGTFYFTNNDPKSAVYAFSQALENDPDNKRALYYIAPSYKGINQPNKAIEYYMELLGHDPNFIQANYNLAQIFIETKDFDKAETYLKKQIEVNNMQWQAYYYLAIINNEAGNKYEALNYLDEVDAINIIKPINRDDYIKILKIKAQVYLDVQEFDKALEVLEELDKFTDDEAIDQNIEIVKGIMEGQ